MPNCGGVPSTPFFYSIPSLLWNIEQIRTKTPEDCPELRLLRLASFDPEALVAALPASSRPDGIPRVAVHAYLLDKIPGPCLWTPSHVRSSGASKQLSDNYFC